MNSPVTSPKLHPCLELLRQNLESVVRGKSTVIEQVMTALLAGGSILIEDVPGVGKTTLAKALAASMELDFQRVQCTPDLLPADVFGFSMFDPQASEFRFRQGPIFTNVLLVDEINRASPRTQSALLEAMEERQVTIEGNHFDLPPPFIVLATQNPLGYQGTFPLPEAQLDRFLMRVAMDYPEPEVEVGILFDHMSGQPIQHIQPVLSRKDLLTCQASVREVKVQQCVAEYLVQLVQRTRHDERIRVGCSPRGSLMLCRTAQAHALLKHRDYVLPDDVQAVAPGVLAHRLVMQGQAHAASQLQSQVVQDLINQIDIPV